jgi:hypothetical protein
MNSTHPGAANYQICRCFSVFDHTSSWESCHGNKLPLPVPTVTPINTIYHLFISSSKNMVRKTPTIPFLSEKNPTRNEKTATSPCAPDLWVGRRAVGLGL